MAHSFRIICSVTEADEPDHVPTPEPPEFPNVVPDRVQQNVKDKFQPTLDHQEVELHEVEEDEDEGTPAHMRGLYRFDEVDQKADIITEIENEAVADCEWYLILYHECTHDKGGGRCEYDNVVSEYGDVPAEFYP